MRVIGRSISAPSANALDPLLSRALLVGLLGVLGSLVAFTRIPSNLAVVYAFIVVALVGDRIVRRSWFLLVLIASAVGLSGLEDGIVWVGNPDRMAGTLHWLSWLTIGLALPYVLTNERRWHLAGTVLVGVAVVHAMVASIEPFYSAPDAPWLSVRRYALTANSGFLAVIAMTGTIVAASRIRGEQRALWVVLALLCLFATFSSGTRTAVLALGVALVAVPLPGRLRWAVVLGAVLAVGGAQTALGQDRFDDRLYSIEGAVLVPLGRGFLDYRRGLDLTPVTSISTEETAPVTARAVRTLPSLTAPTIEVFRATPPATTSEGRTLTVAYSDFPHNMVLQMWWDLGLLGLFLVSLFFLGLSRLRGVWLALGLAFTVYSLFWIPSPGWFAVLALLMGRMLHRREET